MYVKTIIALLGLAAMSVVSAQATDHHPQDGPGVGFPNLVIPLPDDFRPPPPPDDREGRKEWFADAFGALDQDGDGLISKEEMIAAMQARRQAHPEGFGPQKDEKFGRPPGDHPKRQEGSGEGEFEGLSADDPDMADRPQPPPCSEELRASELGVQEENKHCADSESVGNLIFRTVCNDEPYNSEAISLPPNRAADCFDLEAIRGSGITFEIIEESTGNVEFNTIEGKEQFNRLVLTGGPNGTVFRIKLLSGDTPDASVTIRFIDHPTF